MKDSLTFAELREVNTRRCAELFHPVDSWSPTDWACAMAGEAGETCNAVKKLKRYYEGTNTAKDPQTLADCVQAIAGELADTVVYLDLLADRLGIDLGAAVREKFNATSRLRNAGPHLYLSE